jgi:hypothetical protein
VIDSADVLRDPRGVLMQLCAAIHVPFDEAMLSWRAGSRASDGIWAQYWYAAVEASTGFSPYHTRHEPVPDHLQAVADECDGLYQTMYAHRLTTG